MKKVLMISMAALFVVAPCYGNAFKKAAWAVVPYLKNQALIKAAKEGDVQGVKKALKAKAKVDAKDKHGLTAMIYAARNGHNEVVKLLISAGVNVNDQPVAVYNGNDKSVVLRHVFKRRFDCSALIEAARNGHNDVVETLIAAGADVNMSVRYYGLKGSSYETALGVATSPLVIETLIKAGAKK